MDEESSIPQEEEEVEAHQRPRHGPEEAGKHFEREGADEGEEVEGHSWQRKGPSEADKHFKHF